MANIKRANTSGITKTGTAIADVPDAPTIGTATAGSAGSGQATVTYTASATGGAVTTFTATSSPGSVTGTGASPITVSGLTIGTAYTFTVSGANSTGTSPASAASNSITPTEVAKAGFFVGGQGSGTTIDKITFSNDTRSTLSATLSPSRGYSAGFANSGTAGYVVGGTESPDYSTISKLVFTTDSISNLGTGAVGTYIKAVSGMANSGTAGYWGGGNAPGGVTSNIGKLLFSNDSNSIISAKLSQAKAYVMAFANSGTAGYFANGSNSGSLQWYTTINKITFSNDTVSSAGGGNLGTYTDFGTAFANSGTAGYMTATSGSAGGGTSQIEKITFSNDSKSIIAATLSEARSASGSFANSGTAGYLGGGSSTGSKTTINKLTFSNDTRSVITDTLSVFRVQLPGFANSGTL
jgi:hypothetical protein